MTHKLKALQFPRNVFFRADDESGRVEAVFGTGRGGQQPGDDRALLAVLVLQETAQLSVADQSGHVNDGDYVAGLEVSSFVKQGLGGDRRGDRGRRFGAALFENRPATFAFRVAVFRSHRLLEFRALGAGALSEGERTRAASISVRFAAVAGGTAGVAGGGVCRRSD